MAKIVQFPQSRATSGKEPPTAGGPQPPMSLQERIEYDRATLAELAQNAQAMVMAPDARSQILIRATELMNLANALSERAKAQPMPTAAPGFAADLSRLEDAMQDLLEQYNAQLPNPPTAVPHPQLSGVAGVPASGFAWLLVTAGTLAIAGSVFVLMRRA